MAANLADGDEIVDIGPTDEGDVVVDLAEELPVDPITRGFQALTNFPSLSDLGKAAKLGTQSSVQGLKRAGLEKLRAAQQAPRPGRFADSTPPELRDFVEPPASEQSDLGQAARNRSLQSDPGYIETQQAIEGSSQRGREISEQQREVYERNPSLVGRSALTAAASLPQSAAALAVGLVTRSPTLAAAAMAPGTFGSSYEGYRQARLTPEKAAFGAAIDGFIESATELLPAHALLKPGGDATTKFLKYIAAEVPTEVAATFGQELNAELQKNPKGVEFETVLKGLRAGLEQLPETVLSTIMASAVQGGAVSGVQALADKAGGRPAPPSLEGIDPTGDEVVDLPQEPPGGPGATVPEPPRVEETAPAVERYQLQRQEGEQFGQQVQITPLDEETFQYYVRPFLPVGHANTLEEYQAKHPSITHVRLRLRENGQFVLDSGRAGGTPEQLRPDGASALKVDDFNDPRAKQYGAIDSSRAQRRDPNALDPQQDSILTAVAKLGGLRREEAEQNGIDPAEFSRQDHQLSYTFRRNGKSLDELAEAMREFGYPVQDPNQLLDAINAELGGSAAQPVEDEIAAAEQRGAQQQSLAEPITIDDMLDAYSQYPGALEDDTDIGSLHAVEEYPPDFDVAARKLSDLNELAQMIDPAAAEEALQLPSDAEAAQQLWRIINGEYVPSDDQLPQPDSQAGPQGEVAIGATPVGGGQENPGVLEQAGDLSPGVPAGSDAPTGRAVDSELRGPVDEAGDEIVDLPAGASETEAAAEAGPQQPSEGSAADAQQAPAGKINEQDSRVLGLDQNEEALQQSVQKGRPVLQGQGDQGSSAVGGKLPGLPGSYRPAPEQKALPGSQEQRPGVRAGERSVGNGPGAITESKVLPPNSIPRKDRDGSGAGAGVSNSSADSLQQDQAAGSRRSSDHGGIASGSPQQQVRDGSRSDQDSSGVGSARGDQQQNAKGALAQGDGSREGGKSRPSPIDEAAAQADPEPSFARIEAGNQKLGHVRLHGLEISIENTKGSIRRSKPDAKDKWEVEMPAHYGYVRGTTGADGEHFDITLGPRAEDASLPVFVIDQANAKGEFDEHKALAGFDNARAALLAYQNSFAGDFGKKMIASALGVKKLENFAAFKAWLGSADLKTPATSDADQVRWDSMDYSRRQDVAHAQYSGQRRAWHRISSSKWSQLSTGEQDDMRKAMATPAAKIKTKVEAQQPDARDVPAAAAPSSEPTSDHGDTSVGATPANTERLAKWVGSQIAAGKAISWDDLFKHANFFFAGTQAQGKYTPKDAYDAVELALNQHIASRFGINYSVEDAKYEIRQLEKLMSLLPTQTKRTSEQDALQQFSTPPTHSLVVSWVADVTKDDLVLEPSAGIGGLTVFALNAGADVWVNELSERRRELLKKLDKFAGVSGENAEQINNTLPARFKPTVVLMNPPFSNSADRGIKRDTSIGAKHVEAALKTLQPGGRLVAIVGDGMKPDAPTFRKWWADIAKGYSVRANVGISGDEYRKYGTTFDNRIIVIDNTGPSSAAPVTGEVAKVEDLLPLLEGIRNDRNKGTPAASQPDEPSRPQQGSDATVAGSNAQPSGNAGAVADALGTAGRPTGDQPSKPRAPRKGGARAGSATPDADATAKGDGVSDAAGQRIPADAGRAQPGEVPAGGSAAAAGVAAGEDGGDARVAVESVEAAAGEMTGSVFEQYSPQRVRIDGAKPHPGKLVESAAMASVRPPAPTYKPNLPAATITEGKLSDAQLEAVVYAGQAHSELLEDGRRRGYFIGDGTGVGKGREISGVILDNFRQGRKKAIWLSEKSGLIDDARRDFSGVGGDQSKIFPLPANYDALGQTDGVLFGTYSTLRTAAKTVVEGELTPRQRIDQVVNWAGPDFDGVLVFDEAHNARNLLTIEGGSRGAKKGSKLASMVSDIQKRLPKARVLYVSATGATEVENLAYADRLGAWGPGTAFEDVRAFISQISQGGLAAMEVVARDLKQLGMYTARSLSYQDVTYSRLQHDLTDFQSEIYDELAKAWQVVLRDMNKALALTEGEKDSNVKGGMRSQFWGAHQRFFNQVITAFQMPTLIEDMEKELAAGNAAVLQLVNTNEAILNAKLKGVEEDQVEELDMTPREGLMTMVRKSFPVVQYESYVDPETQKEGMRVVQDAEGNPVLNREAVAARDALLLKLEQIRIPEGPLEQVITHFGNEAVGEVTGRGRRAYYDREGKVVIQKRNGQSNRADANAFQDDKKQILIFSDAGGTGFSFQADLTKKNQRKRIHYLVQPGWRADKAVQGFGRTHRTNQASAPHYKLLTTDLAAQKRFVSSIARRLDQLGALTKGQRDTANQGLFSASDNLESVYAEDAVWDFFKDLAAERIAGLDKKVVMAEMGLDAEILDDKGRLIEEKIPNVPKFLNRLLSLTKTLQRQVFEQFENRMRHNVEAASLAGTLDVGMETMRAEHVETKRDDLIHTDKKTGAETRFVELEITNPRQFTEFPRDVGFTGKTVYYRNEKSGKVWAVFEAGNITSKGGQVRPRYGRIGTTSRSYGDSSDVGIFSGGYKKISEKDAKELWDQENAALDPNVTEPVYLITGALLPIWDRLPGHNRIVRMQSDDGKRYLGRYIPRNDLAAVLKRLQLDSNLSKLTPADVEKKISGREVAYLTNGWRIMGSRVSNEKRIELMPGYPSYSMQQWLESIGVFEERIEFKQRYFIPVGAAGHSTIEKLLGKFPLTELKSIDDVNVSPSVRSAPRTEQDAEQIEAGIRDRVVRRARAHLGRIAARWPDVKVIVKWDEFEVPVRYMRALGQRGDIGNTRGFYGPDNDHVYILMGNIDSLEQAEEILFHEVEGHLAIRDFFGQSVVPFLNRVFIANPVEVKKIGIKYGYYNAKGEPANGYTPTAARLHSADEYVAKLAEELNSGSPRSLKNLWQVLLSYWRQAMRAMGFRYAPTENEIRGWIIRSQSALAAKRPGTGKTKAANEAIRAATKKANEVMRAAGNGPAGAQGGLGFAHSWNAPTDSKLDTWIGYLQDKHIDTKRVIDAIANANSGIIEDRVNVRQKEELYSQRLAKRLELFSEDEIIPLLRQMNEQAVDIYELNRFLLARHVPEATAEYERKNPGQGDGMAGMTLQEASDYMNSLSPPELARLTALAARVDRIIEGTRQLHVGYTLDSATTVGQWRDTYDHYVPLFRADMDEGPMSRTGMGAGFSVRGPGTRQRTGSMKPVANILASVVQQREKALTRGEKNRISNAVVALALENPNSDWWEVNDPPMIAYVDESTGLTEHRIDPSWKSHPNVLTARVADGKGGVKEVAVVFNEDNERAVRMAMALKNLDEDQLTQLSTAFGKVTRYFAMVNTQYNPVFGPYNFMRDVEESLINLSSTPLAGSQGAVAKKVPAALVGIYSSLRGRRRGTRVQSVWADRFEEFERVGGKTAFRQMFASNRERAEALQAEMKKLTEGNFKGGLRALGGWLSDYNETLENAVRLAVYQTGVERGLSNEQAASIAKNITVNFNRRGSKGAQIGSYYAFFNAAVQGIARVGQTLAGPRGRAIILGGISIGVIQAIWLFAAGLDDDDVPEWVQQNSFVIPLPGGSYLSVPYPLGFKFLPAIGRLTTQWMLNRWRDVGKYSVNMMDVLLHNFNPLGNSGMSMQSVLPTAADPMVALAENKDFAGRDIALKDRTDLDPTPGPSRAKAGASDPGLWLSKALNYAMGGNEYRPGIFSPTPDQIDYLIGQATGGAGRTLLNTAQVGKNILTRDEVPAYKIPFFNRLYGTTSDSTGESRTFYNNVRRLNILYSELEGRGKADDGFEGFVEENPLARLSPAANKTATRISDLRKEKRRMEATGADREDIKAVDEAILQMIRSFNERVRELEKSD